jgi:ferritin-like metal-binding protein YciE
MTHAGRLPAPRSEQSRPAGVLPAATVPSGAVGQNQGGAKLMGIFSKDIKTMDDLFVHTLQDIYYAENQILKSLPTMIEKATSPELKQAFQTHLTETQGQVKRLEQVFQMHGQPVKGVTCAAMDGILNESKEIMGEVEDKEVLDAAMLASAQAVEHYEITRYGTLVAWAKQLGRHDCASVLQQNLDEEKATDKKLSTLAESRVNQRAAA